MISCDVLASYLSISQIDSINHDVHLAFALLARRYNSQVPVNRLYPELIGMVFEHLREPTKLVDPNESLDQSVFAPYKPLIHVMTVCHRWHVIATEKASLWTDVDYSWNPAGSTCLLQRSGTAPIHLRVILEGAEDMVLFTDIMRANAPRLRHLDVCVIGAEKVRMVEQLLRNDMPLLQSLKLADEYYHKNGISRSALGSFPSLRGMMLMGFFMAVPDSDVRPFAKLTHLHISMLSEISLASITAFLDATPALEVLELHECTAVTLAELPTRTTTLAHLTNLTIRRMFTRVAEVLMPSLALPRAAVVCLWLDVDAASPLTDALLPNPQYWRDATRVRITEGPYSNLTIHLEAPTHPHRVALCLEFDGEGEGERQPLWPLPVPTLPTLPAVTAAHLSVFGRWRTALGQFSARFPALTTLIVEGPVQDQEAAEQMVDALRDVLGPGAESESPDVGAAEASRSARLKLKEVALVLPCVVPGLTARLAPALRRRKRDGVPVERLGTCIVPVHEPGEHQAPEAATGRDMGDALAEYVGAGRVEHEENAFWRWDEELWRQENEFWEVPGTWW